MMAIRTWLALLAGGAALVSGFSYSQAEPSVLISEMCDPQSNYTTDRFIEIYNTGFAAVDLDGWALVAVGNNTTIFTWSLSGSIAPGQALVAGDQTTVMVFPVHFPAEAWSNSNGLWNGKVGDGAKLIDSSGAVVDYAVVTGTAFENADYVRNYGVTAPNPIYNPSEWTATPVNLATDGSPGSHSTVQPIPGPTISNIVTNPAPPVAGTPVHVYADVTDSLSITSVGLLWGTAPSSLVNEIVMSVSSGSTYMTDAPIPGQSAGTTVYFKVRAVNNAPATSLSAMRSYSLPYEVTIYEIQGQAPASPYDGRAVITHGVATACYGSYFVMQDGSGAWNGIWVRAATAAPAIGDSLTVRGTVTESAGLGYASNTLLTDALILSDSPGAVLPEATVISTAAASSEDYEGVLVKVEGAVCTSVNVGYGEWQVNDGSGPARVDHLAYRFTPTLGSSYDLTCPMAYRYGNRKLEPRDGDDVMWVSDASPPSLFYATGLSDTTVLVTFSEAVGEISASRTDHYAIAGLNVETAQVYGGHPDQVLLNVSAMSAGTYTLWVGGVEDLYGNVIVGDSLDFGLFDNGVPAGYYADAEALFGGELKAVLHNIIRNHTVWSYDYAWTAYRTTDVKPNGKVWDIYSDVPWGTSFYEYMFGLDEGGIGGEEGNGYTREHAWPKSWFGGEVTPMYSDLFILYPCDAHVNGNRGVYAYGEVGLPDWTSLNGSKRGPSSYPGYIGTVFEPIDEYKGDLARAYFYMSTRYSTEDAGWPGGPMTDGAGLKSWAVNMLLEWHAQDPVSEKEIRRNGAIYALQHNRNPFVDRPEFAVRVFDAAAGVAGGQPGKILAGLGPIYPNPPGSTARLRYSVPEAGRVTIALYSVQGRKVATLVDAIKSPGEYQLELSTGGLAVGVYFCKFEAGGCADTHKLVVLK